jgi:cell fate regulator YaaT (PSP1 superfamily)
MSCGSCGSKDGKVSGCGSGGSCSSGGCNRNNVFDWFSFMPTSSFENFNIIEVSFKKGARKGFYRNTNNLDLYKGQLVVVEAAQGYDIGEVNLQGELVRAQMKKRRVTERDDTIRNVVRHANNEDIDIFLDGRNKENETMIRARAIARSMNLEMKIGDIEYQGDGKKLTVYYIADGRVDFRELVKVYVRDFKAKIEMRQIGARQEAGRIGGIGTCGRELCCSTWLQDFKSVTTQAVRYQNLSINTEKMSGQCGRLKCCLNYELDTYNDALKKFPKNAEKIETAGGTAYLRKTEILKKLMWYSLESTPGVYFKLDIDTVQQLLWMNKQGQKPEALGTYTVVEEKIVDESKHEDLVGHVSLTSLEEKDRKNRQGNRNRNQSRQQPQNRNQQQNRPKDNPREGGNKPTQTNSNSDNNQQQRKNPNPKFKNRNQQNKGPKDKPNE